MIKLLTSPIGTAVLSLLLYAGTTVAVWKTPKPPPPVEEDNAAGHRVGPSWDFINPEADQLVAELKAEKKALAKREQDLNDLSARLESERAELKMVTQSVRQLQSDFDQNVVRITEEEMANLKKLAKVYAAMDPGNAAKILQAMDDVAIIKIMVFMKDSETAAIWESWAKQGDIQAKRAALLSERLRLSSSHTSTTK
jgi:flagellar motility protein MotE (MotC chaperone)